jgi:hypothetical protein
MEEGESCFVEEPMADNSMPSSRWRMGMADMEISYFQQPYRNLAVFIRKPASTGELCNTSTEKLKVQAIVDKKDSVGTRASSWPTIYIEQTGSPRYRVVMEYNYRK